MLITETIYGVTAAALFALGVRGALLHRSLLGRLLSINVCGAGVFRGDTATTLAAAGVKDIAPLDSAVAIADPLVRFVAAIRRAEVALPCAESVRQASRMERTGELVRLLDSAALRPPEVRGPKLFRRVNVQAKL